MACLIDTSFYRAFSTRSELKADRYFAMHSGNVQHRTTSGVAAFVCIRTDGFAPFARLIRVVVPNFRWSGRTFVAPGQLSELLSVFDGFSARLAHCRTAADLKELDPTIEVSDANALIARAHLIRSAERVGSAIYSTRRQRTGFWIWGINPVL